MLAMVVRGLGNPLNYGGYKKSAIGGLIFLGGGGAVVGLN